MTRHPIRRGQLITPFGVGAMYVFRDGTSMVCAALDHWYQRQEPGSAGRDIDQEEFRVEEWRLQRLLRVSHFMLPPDYREPRPGQASQNQGLTVPYLVFPRWHFCPGCRRLKVFPESMRSRQICGECRQRGPAHEFAQVPVIALCDHGHLQDFPWNEWVHRTPVPACDGRRLKLRATGAASLAAQIVSCDACDSWRSLAGITQGPSEGGSTFLTDNLEGSGSAFLCRGMKPWQGQNEHDSCQRPLRGSLRSAANVYYPQVRSALYIPRGETQAVKRAVGLLEEPAVRTAIGVAESVTGQPVGAATIRRIRQVAMLFRQFSDDDLDRALQVTARSCEEAGQGGEGAPDLSEETLRRDEYEVLRHDRSDDLLDVQHLDPAAFDHGVFDVAGCFRSVGLVTKLRETRALCGFTRIFPESGQTPAALQALLWKRKPAFGGEWLPAVVVFGEGLFFELDEDRVRGWIGG